MKTNYVPAIIMLLAGLVDSVISIYYKLDLYSFTKRLLLVLVIFYILGCVVKIILDNCGNRTCSSCRIDDKKYHISDEKTDHNA